MSNALGTVTRSAKGKHQVNLCHPEMITNDYHFQTWWPSKNLYLLEKRANKPGTIADTAIWCLNVHEVALISSSCMIYWRPCSNTWSSTLLTLPVKVVFISVCPATLVALKCALGSCKWTNQLRLHSTFVCNQYYRDTVNYFVMGNLLWRLTKLNYPSTLVETNRIGDCVCPTSFLSL